MTGSATIASRQISRPHPPWQLLIRAQTTDVALIRIERLSDVAQYPKGIHQSEHDLETHGTVTALQPGDSLARNPGTIAELGLGQSTELAPGLNVCAELSKRSANGQRRYN